MRLLLLQISSCADEFAELKEVTAAGWWCDSISCWENGCLYQNQLPRSVFIQGVLRMSHLTKRQWRIVCLRGGRRTMVHGGGSECNTLYQTQIYWFVHSAASPGHNSLLRVTTTTRTICYQTLNLITWKCKWDMHCNVGHWVLQKCLWIGFCSDRF